MKIEISFFRTWFLQFIFILFPNFFLSPPPFTEVKERGNEISNYQLYPCELYHAEFTINFVNTVLEFFIQSFFFNPFFFHFPLFSFFLNSFFVQETLKDKLSRHNRSIEPAFLFPFWAKLFLFSNLVVFLKIKCISFSFEK